MKRISKFLPVLGLVVLMSCASSNIETKKFTDEDFSKFKTFAYLPSTAFKADEFKSDSDKSIEESLISLLNAKMIEEGYSVNRDNPDLLILLTTSDNFNSNEDTDKSQSTTSGDGPSGPNYAALTTAGYKRYFNKSNDALSNEPYKKSTLIVEVFSSKSKELLWIGAAKDFKTHISDQTLMSRMVNEIFNKFPKI